MPLRLNRVAVLAGVLGVCLVAASTMARGDDLAGALDRIAADSLKGHLSFIASDLLEGRDTPSRGLDIAAEYIAAQFRRAGLEPVGDDGYFQTARWIVRGPDPSTFSLDINTGKETLRVADDQTSFFSAAAVDVSAPLLKLGALDDAALDALDEKTVSGRAVVADIPEPSAVARNERAAVSSARLKLLRRLQELKAAVVLAPDGDSNSARGITGARLVDPENTRGFDVARSRPIGPALVRVHEPKVVEWLRAIPAGTQPDGATITLKLGPPVDRPVAVRNVAGLLRGSDPELRDTFVMVTAHYDHVGRGAAVNGDSIYNGANDDGSGTVSVIEVASALAKLDPRPKRSILFVTFFGEEHGLLGSAYYGRHPLVPLAKTVADLNLEQVGRTDDTEGSREGKASLTGFDFSTVGDVIKAAGEAEGIDVFKHPRNSDAFFGASDNQALANVGIPAHTLCVAFIYPDYHGALDHWDKIDYVHMAKINRVVARSLATMANSDQPPKWNENNPKTERYRKAWEKLHAPTGDAK